MAAKKTPRRSGPAAQRRSKVPASRAPRRKAARKTSAPRRRASPRPRAPASRAASERRSWWRRHALHLILAAFLLAAFAWLWLIPVILGRIAARELDRAFAAEVRVWALSGFLGDAPVLKGLELTVPGAPGPLLRIDELTLHLREPLWRAEGLDVEEVSILRGTVVLDLAAFAADDAEATPGDQPDAGEEPPAGPARDSGLPERLRLRDVRLELRFGAGFTVPITGLRATVVRHGLARYEVEEFAGTVYGGSLEGSGDARVEERIHWHLQLRLGGVRIEDAVRRTSLAAGITRGELAAYIDLRSSEVLGGPPRGAGGSRLASPTSGRFPSSRRSSTPWISSPAKTTRSARPRPASASITAISTSASSSPSAGRSASTATARCVSTAANCRPTSSPASAAA